ncbi:hypothetical protein [Paenarthrobacter aromaticivorans]|uniref:hypothetical protein n=1 Tax=Paenarthrobacter aromaticivorans TaxID=2849150 RepID=UPI003A80E6A5
MRIEEWPSGTRVVRDALRLAMDPELWTLDLRDGSQMTVLAHAYCIENDEVVFSLLFEGEPNFEVETLRVPLGLFPEGFD